MYIYIVYYCTDTPICTHLHLTSSLPPSHLVPPTSWQIPLTPSPTPLPHPLVPPTSWLRCP